MIFLLTGKPGTGKSYTLVLLIKECLQNGEDVFSNLKVDIRRLQIQPKIIKKNFFLNLFRKEKLPLYTTPGRLYYWKDLAEFRNINNGVCIMDEAQTYFSSRRWREMTAEDELKFQQHRHQGIDIFGAVQNLKRMDPVVRELAGYTYVIRRIGRLFIRKRYDPEEVDKARKKSSETKFYLLKKQFASAYDTKQLRKTDVELMEHEKFTHMSTFFD